jgi:hypothetical protein
LLCRWSQGAQAFICFSVVCFDVPHSWGIKGKY